MPNRAAKFASAVFASVLASAYLTAIPRSAAGTDDECLSAPKGETPQGSHWYYRFDRASKRQCWYLRDEGEVAAGAAAPKPSSPAKPASATMQPLMLDARAELPVQSRSARPNREDRATPAAAANAALSEADKVLQPAAPPAVATSRWPGQSTVFAAANAATNVAASPPASAGPVLENAYANADAGTAQQVQPLSSPATSQFIVPDTPTHSVQMLLAAIMGALALAGVMARLIFNFVGTRRRARRKFRGRREAIWKSAAPARKKQTIYQGAGKLAPQPHLPRDLDQVGDPDDRIAELLRDFSRKTRAANQRQSGVGSFR